MKEIWKRIEGLENYEISNLGRVRSIDRIVECNNKKRLFKGQILKQYVLKNGYLKVCICLKGKTKNLLVHRLVANAFVPNERNVKYVDHIDTDKTNNISSNLKWVTASENYKNPTTYKRHLQNAVRGRRHHNYGIHEKWGRIIKGKQHYKAKGVIQMSMDGEYIKTWETVCEAARSFGTNIATNISYCCEGKRKSAFGYKWKYK